MSEYSAFLRIRPKQNAKRIHHVICNWLRVKVPLGNTLTCHVTKCFRCIHVCAYAVDASEASERISQWARSQLVRHGDSVHILHIVPAAPVRPVAQAYGDGIIMSIPYAERSDYENIRKRQAQIKEDLTARFSRLFENSGA